MAMTMRASATHACEIGRPRWNMYRPHRTAEGEGERWRLRLHDLPHHCLYRTVTLGLVDGPAMATVDAAATTAGESSPPPLPVSHGPELRPGMYIGDYSHNNSYGLYGNESLLLERRTFALGEGGLASCHREELSRLFGRGDATAPHSNRVSEFLKALSESGEPECTLRSGAR